MDEVYRARDTRLKRDVAIKVLPDAFARDTERIARFQREAEVLATLNHSNIAAVYGFEEGSTALIFYRIGNKMMAVDVATAPAVSLSTPRLLFEQPYAFGAGTTLPNYDVMRDGRFVMVKDESSAGRLNVILNWPADLARVAAAPAQIGQTSIEICNRQIYAY